MDLIALKKKSE